MALKLVTTGRYVFAVTVGYVLLKTSFPFIVLYARIANLCSVPSARFVTVYVSTVLAVLVTLTNDFFAVSYQYTTYPSAPLTLFHVSFTLFISAVALKLVTTGRYVFAVTVGYVLLRTSFPFTVLYARIANLCSVPSASFVTVYVFTLLAVLVTLTNDFFAVSYQYTTYPSAPLTLFHVSFTLFISAVALRPVTAAG